MPLTQAEFATPAGSGDPVCAAPPPPPPLKRKVRVSTSLGGLQRFHKVPEQLGPAGWRDWPCCTLSCDQGSDMLSATFALMYYPETKINGQIFFDPSHGCNRDFWGGRWKRWGCDHSRS